MIPLILNVQNKLIYRDKVDEWLPGVESRMGIKYGDQYEGSFQGDGIGFKTGLLCGCTTR